MHHQMSPPAPLTLVLVAEAPADPTERKAPLSIRGRLGRVISTGVESVILRCLPRTIQAVAHAVARLMPVVEFREEEIPPIAHAEQIWTFVGQVQVGRP